MKSHFRHFEIIPPEIQFPFHDQHYPLSLIMIPLPLKPFLIHIKLKFCPIYIWGSARMEIELGVTFWVFIANFHTGFNELTVCFERIGACGGILKFQS